MSPSPRANVLGKAAAIWALENLVLSVDSTAYQLYCSPALSPQASQFFLSKYYLSYPFKRAVVNDIFMGKHFLIDKIIIILHGPRYQHK